MRKLATLAWIVGLVVALTPGPADAQARSLEDTLKAAKIEYTPLEGNEFKVPVTIENETVVIIAKEAFIGDGTEPNLKLFHFYTLVAEGRHPFPPEGLKKLAEINDGIYIGKLSLGTDGAVFYSSSMWAAGATPELVVNELVMAHIQCLAYRKALKPLLEKS